jgi:flagellar basal-body rod protein FlgC
MSLLGTLNISASALTAQQLRLDVLAQNMANVDTTRTAEGGPYRRRNVVFQEFRSNASFADTLRANLRSGLGSGASRIFGPGRGFHGGMVAQPDFRDNQGVIVRAIVPDMRPGPMVYDPSHPDANEEGYVQRPNVNIVTEMVDLISTSRSFEANVTSMNVTKAMINKTFEIAQAT